MEIDREEAQKADNLIPLLRFSAFLRLSFLAPHLR
jgi:hypothetical protein